MTAENANTRLFLEAIQDKSNVKGFTHDFYNYPARFSPLFVREAIKTFTEPGDLIIDPFVGGGTTLVEAKLLNRNSIGFDISSLATFITTTKVTALNEEETSGIQKWVSGKIKTLNPYFSLRRPSFWEEEGYHKNVSDKSTWPIRNIIEHFLFLLQRSRFSDKQKNFLRCSILKTGQWALDNKKVIPCANRFRNKLADNIKVMCKGALEFSTSLNEESKKTISLCINKPSSEINTVNVIKDYNPPSLILTSPPYPGVHVVYHRWQIKGRKETPAPFWIANSLDGHGLSHYAMGGRQEKGLETYYSNILKSFSSIKSICSEKTLLIQMLAFSEIDWQLPKYLDIMNLAGFEEVQLTIDRIWRQVPNRKWYVETKDSIESSNEVVLFHKLIR
jgi:hypothetical protein